MKIGLQRALDSQVGLPLCALLTAWRCVTERRAPGAGSPRRIAFSKYLGLGSILLALPTVRHARRLHPEASVLFLTFAGNRGLFELLPEVDEVVAFDTGALRRFASDFFARIGALRRRPPDLLVDLELFSRFSAAVGFLSGSRERTGFYLPEVPRGDLLTRHVFYSPYRHIAQIFLSLVDPEKARAPIPPAEFRVEVPERFVESARQALRRHGADADAPFFAANPNAGDMCLERRWDPPKFADLLGRAARRFGVPVILIGAPSERGFVESVRRAADAPGVMNLAGGVDLPTLAGVLHLSRAFVTNDSGPLHLAAAVGTPTLSFFGPESPALYGPVGEGHVVFFTGVLCSPCLTVHNRKIPPCHGENVCLRTLGVDEVWERAEPALGRWLAR